LRRRPSGKHLVHELITTNIINSAVSLPRLIASVSQ
jgi:hypothetical protein